MSIPVSNSIEQGCHEVSKNVLFACIYFFSIGWISTGWVIAKFLAGSILKRSLQVGVHCHFDFVLWTKPMGLSKWHMIGYLLDILNLFKDMKIIAPLQ